MPGGHALGIGALCAAALRLAEQREAMSVSYRAADCFCPIAVEHGWHALARAHATPFLASCRHGWRRAKRRSTYFAGYRERPARIESVRPCACRRATRQQRRPSPYAIAWWAQQRRAGERALRATVATGADLIRTHPRTPEKLVVSPAGRPERASGGPWTPLSATVPPPRQPARPAARSALPRARSAALCASADWGVPGLIPSDILKIARGCRLHYNGIAKTG